MLVIHTVKNHICIKHTSSVCLNATSIAAFTSQRSEAPVAINKGFTAIKFDPAGPYTIFDGHQPSLSDLELSEQFCKLIRSKIGNKADLLFGTHGQFTPSGAIRLAKRL